MPTNGGLIKSTKVLGAYKVSGQSVFEIMNYFPHNNVLYPF